MPGGFQALPAQMKTRRVEEWGTSEEGEVSPSGGGAEFGSSEQSPD